MSAPKFISSLGEVGVHAWKTFQIENPLIRFHDGSIPPSFSKRNSSLITPMFIPDMIAIDHRFSDLQNENDSTSLCQAIVDKCKEIGITVKDLTFTDNFCIVS